MNKQQEIIKIVSQLETATTEKIFDLISWKHYHYRKTHLGKILSSMVKNGKIQRIKKGVFVVGKSKKEAQPDPNQQSLFSNQ